MNEEQFKATLGKMPTGITVITTNIGDILYGFTANSFTSVSLKPALISFCLNKNAGSIDAFKKSKNFAVSILSNKQSNLSKHFSTSTPNKFIDIQYELGKNSSCPMIKEALCWLECKKSQEYDGGDHIIFLGEVMFCQINNDLPPLIYFARAYRDLK